MMLLDNIVIVVVAADSNIANDVMFVCAECVTISLLLFSLLITDVTI